VPDTNLAFINPASCARYTSPWHIAIIYANLGDKEQAFAWLEECYQGREHDLVYSRPFSSRFGGERWSLKNGGANSEALGRTTAEGLSSIHIVQASPYLSKCFFQRLRGTNPKFCEIDGNSNLRSDVSSVHSGRSIGIVYGHWNFKPGEGG
jgi:hypothetical protein